MGPPDACVGVHKGDLVDRERIGWAMIEIDEPVCKFAREHEIDSGGGLRCDKIQVSVNPRTAVRLKNRCSIDVLVPFSCVHPDREGSIHAFVIAAAVSIGRDGLEVVTNETPAELCIG